MTETCPTCNRTFEPIPVSELGQYGHRRPDGLDAFWHPELDCWANVPCWRWLADQSLRPGWSVVGFASAAEALADPVVPRPPNRAERRAKRAER